MFTTRGSGGHTRLVKGLELRRFLPPRGVGDTDWSLGWSLEDFSPGGVGDTLDWSRGWI